MQNRRSFIAFLGALVLSAQIPATLFATDRTDIVSGLNTLSQLMTKISGDTMIAVVYDPANAASTADANGIKNIIDSGMALPGGGKLSAVLVGVKESAKLSRARIAFLTPGLAPYLGDLNMATSAAGILTISTDIDCVRAAKCIIGIVTSPNITIYYSKEASDNAKIEFSQAFSMLVKQP